MKLVGGMKTTNDVVDILIESSELHAKVYVCILAELVAVYCTTFPLLCGCVSVHDSCRCQMNLVFISVRLILA
jgi:hypothetical protein